MFYLFHGNDRHTQLKVLSELQIKLGDPDTLDLNTTRLDGHNLTLSELRNACDSVPFLASKRLVVVTDLIANDFPFQDELLAYLPGMPETTRLVLLESQSLSANHPVVRLAESDPKGFVKVFDRPEGSALQRWIRQRVIEAGGKMSPRAEHLLADNIGSNLTLLENEIEKLVLYKGQSVIEAEDVALLCPYVAEASVFDLVDALGNRNVEAAALGIQRKLSEGTEPFYLFAMIVRQFRLLIQVKELAQAGTQPPGIARVLKIPGFVAAKLYHQSHNFSQTQLDQIYGRLLDFDLQAKTGGTDMTTSLCLLIGALAD